jgi:hypothetical protein
MIAAAFSGSAAPPVTSDPYYEYTTLLLPGNGTNGAQNNTFLDSSTNNFTITRNGNTTQGTFSPFSQTGWGNYFSGSSQYLTVPNGTFVLGSNNFVVEAFIYVTDVTAAARSIVVGQTDAATAGGSSWDFTVNQTTGTLKGVLWIGGGATVITSTNAVPLNQWVHVAFVRTSGTASLFINGTKDGTNTGLGTSSVQTGSTSYSPSIGRNGAGSYFSGYISNCRVIIGAGASSVYNASNSSITVPTAPLTAVTNTVVLTCQSNRFIDNSSSPVTITVGGSPSVQAFSPFNPSASWSAATYGGSGYFDGAGDYIFISANSAFQFNGDFTVECWFYSGSGTTTSKYDQIVGTIESSATGYWRLGSEFNGGKQLWFTWTNGSYNDINTSFSVSDNSWHHLAVSRISNSVRLFVDGVQKGSTTTVTTALTASAPLMVMNSTQGANQTQGYVSSLRIIKGQGLYSGTFTPPVTPFTTSSVGSTGAGAAGSITGTVGVLLNFTNAGIYDATSKNDLETVGNAQISTTQSKWGGSSMAFDGTGDYLYQAPTPFIRLGTGDFTCECWVRFNVVTGTQGIFQLADSYLQSSLSNNGVGLSTTSGTGWLFFAKNSQTFTYSPIVPAAANTWMHVALVRYSGTTKLYVNGTGDAALTASSDTTNYTATYLALGGVYGGNSLNGYIQDFRITVGVARYTANFTPPTAAFPTL